MKAVRFHAKALGFIREQSTSIRLQIGEALRDLQRGLTLGMPLSRPMSTVAFGAHELRVKDAASAVRIFYVVKTKDAIWVFHGFTKKSAKTPISEIELGRQRLREVQDGKA